MTFTERKRAQGWSEPLILWSKIAAALGTLITAFLVISTAMGILVAMPSRMAQVEAQVRKTSAEVDTLKRGNAQWQKMLDSKVDFLVSSRCDELTLAVKRTLKNSGGVNCEGR